MSDEETTLMTEAGPVSSAFAGAEVVSEEKAQAMVEVGAVAAAFVGAGLGSFAMALVTILARFGLFVPPNLYPPVGNLTGKIGLAIAVWLVSWILLHVRWTRSGLDADLGKTIGAALALTVLGVLGTFLPFFFR